MEHHAANQLHVVVDHVPDHFVSCRHPLVVPNGFIALNLHIGFGSCKFSVTRGSSYFQLSYFFKSSGGFFDDGKGGRHHLVQHLFQFGVALLFQGVDLVEELVFLVYCLRRQGLYLSSDIGDFIVNGLELLVDARTKGMGLFSKLIVR